MRHTKADSTETNKLAIDTQASNAPNVAKPIATRKQVMHFTVNSHLCSWHFSGAKALTMLARSIARPKRPTITFKIEPIPVSKKTGATASRMASETR